MKPPETIEVINAAIDAARERGKYMYVHPAFDYDDELGNPVSGMKFSEKWEPMWESATEINKDGLVERFDNLVVLEWIMEETPDEIQDYKYCPKCRTSWFRFRGRLYEGSPETGERVVEDGDDIHPENGCTL